MCLALTTLIANYEIARHRFRFAVPLVLAALGEVVAIAIDHRTVDDVVRIVVAANAFAALVAGLDLALRPRLIKAIAALGIAIAGAGALSGCAAHATMQTAPTALVAAPQHAFRIAVLPDGRAAVLAGDHSSKGVWLVPMHAGPRTSFSVSNGATSIATTATGEILVGLAVGRAGAVEVWSSSGSKRATVPVSRPVVVIVGAERPLAIVSLGSVAAAEQLDVARGRVDRVVPLPPNVVWGADCRAGSEPAIVVADRTSAITVVRLSDAAHARAGSRGRTPVCLPGASLLCALSPLERSPETAFELLDLHTLLQAHELPTNRYAIAQALAPDGSIYLLDSGPRVSSVSRYARSALADT